MQQQSMLHYWWKTVDFSSILYFIRVRYKWNR